jgi:hypothetical protein
MSLVEKLHAENVRRGEKNQGVEKEYKVTID